jgi:3-hydroxymyristoyl/3-hydroxydecanoyl-(acyl carrier protein) dehydratase
MRLLGSFRIKADHPSLPGHFPGRPVVPGVVLLDEVLTLLQAAHPGQAAELPQVKFLRPVLPNETVTVQAAASAMGRVSFLACVQGQDVLRGSVALAAT